MLRRELAIALGAPLPWLIAALAALLCGHGFLLAIDLYAAGSRSVQAGGLMAREFDPLLGLVRPTLGGLYVSASLLLPLVTTRPLSIEKERRSLGPLLLLVGGAGRLLLCKWVAALAGAALLFFGPLTALALWRIAGGHLHGAETAVALLGHLLHVVLLSAIACAAAAFAGTLAQATAATLLFVLSSWAIDAAEGFAALSWLGGASGFSLSTHLAPFERGTLALADCLWFGCGTAGALALAYVGLRFDWRSRLRGGAAAAVVLCTAVALWAAGGPLPAWDATEHHRASLPPAVVVALRALPGPIELVVELDRDDARRRQLESDVLAKLRLSRPDLKLRFPPDDGPGTEASRGEAYGRIEVRAGGGRKETYSGSRRELVTLVFEAAGLPLPDFAQLPYPGYTHVIEGRPRALLAALSYGAGPLLLATVGLWLTRPRRRRAAKGGKRP